ncbi:MAG: fibronectin type III domain-containing protein, partial [Candidatus Margulisiibacteriota bacterium]
ITIPSGSTFDINTATLVVPGDIIIQGTLEATTGLIQLTGNFTNEATFTSGTGTVEFTGTSGAVQIISGDNSFYNFLCSSGGLILSFEAFATGGTTQEIAGAFSVNGGAALIYIRSTTDGSQAHINPSGTRSVTYVDVKDSNNVEGTEIDPPNSVDSGNTENWFTLAVTVEAPNGGETWEAGTSHNITWETFDSPADSIDLYYSIDGGSSYAPIATAEADDGVYAWIVSHDPTTEAKVKIEALKGSDIATDESDAVFTIQAEDTPPSTPESVSAEALPAATPTYVQLTWEASTDEADGSGLAGYNVYRAATPEGSYTKIMSLITGTSTNDTTVTLGTDYYYKLKAQDNAGNESGFSNMASAPLLALTREAVVAAPVTYSGGATDPVPGATITYYLYYNNKGFAKASSITIIDKIPAYTEYKMNTATGESITTVVYSSDEASSWTYTPSGTYIDVSVTHIKWNCVEMSSGGGSKVEYGSVIK